MSTAAADLSRAITMYETNRDVCRRSALRCSELPSKCTNSEIITYKTKTKTKTKTKFYWSEIGLVVRPKSQTTSLMSISYANKKCNYTASQRKIYGMQRVFAGNSSKQIASILREGIYNQSKLLL